MSGNKIKTAVGAVVLAAAAFTAGTICSDEINSVIAVNSTALDKGQQGRYREILNKLSELDTVIDRYYMDDGSIDTQNMSDGLYKGYIYGLNEKYTVYYTPEEYKQMMADAEGVYGGIGVTVTQNAETMQISIVAVSEGSPGEEAGLKEGDLIYKVDGEDIQGQDLNTVVSKVQGEEGSEVTLTLYRPETGETLEKTLKRRKMDAVTVNYGMFEDKIGYIQIKGFEEVTVSQFDEAVQALQKENMQGLVIDVRGNPGGNMTSVCPILDRILPEGLLVYTEDKNGRREEEYADNEQILELPMAVLVNGSSASASEIFAAALQDYDWAEIVGEQTYGKGIVQYVIPLSDGSAIKLTSAKYFTPKGRSIHGVGVTPDIKVTIKSTDTTDTQLEAAAAAVKSKINAG